MAAKKRSETRQRSSDDSSPENRYRPLSTWPVAILIALMIGLQFVPRLVEDGPAMLWMVSAFGPLLCSIIIVLWWITFSRARWFERILGFLGIAGLVAGTMQVVDPSMYGPATMMLIIPLGIGLFGLGLILLQNTLSFKRTTIALLFALLGLSFTTLLKGNGMWGNFALGLKWRWTPSTEELLAKSDKNSLQSRPDIELVKAAIEKPEWAEFRGGAADNVFRGKFYSRTWSSNPPKELWRIPVGPAWSSFVVAGPILFSQEQRGENETVVCYDADNGKVQWVREIPGRFDDPLGGPGPRATPTLAGGKLFSQGARGALLSLDPLSGEILWQKSLTDVAKREPPMWGFSASPLVVGDVVVAYAGGDENLGLLAFEKDTGELKWSAASGVFSYSSPQLFQIAGRDLIGLTSEQGLHLYDPLTGNEFLKHDWRSQGYRACQPHLLPDNKILLPSSMGYGTRLLQIDTATEPWSTKELWTSRDLKPDFNDFVIYKDHIYGFDAAIFTCVRIADGKRQWKGGRYGKGQVVLLEDSGLLLVAAEDGDIVLVAAEPTGHQELARIKAFNGKVWNHPVIIGNRLYIRNDEEAVCYELPTE